MSDINEKYWDLIEKANFEALSPEEQEFIKVNFSIEDFNFNRKLNEMAQDDQIEPKSKNRSALLLAHQKRKKHNYKYVVGVAVGILLMLGFFEFFQSDLMNKNISFKNEKLADTIYKTEVVRDTFYITQNPDTIYQKVYISPKKKFPNVNINRQNENSLVNTPIIEIESSDIVNKGIPANDEETSLFNDFLTTNRFGQ